MRIRLLPAGSTAPSLVPPPCSIASAKAGMSTITQCPDAGTAGDGIRIVDHQSEALRAGRRVLPGQRRRNVGAAAAQALECEFVVKGLVGPQVRDREPEHLRVCSERPDEQRERRGDIVAPILPPKAFAQNGAMR